MYKISYSKQAIKSLKKMPKNTAKKIRDKLQKLAERPYENKQIKVLKGMEGYRLRVGD